MDDLLRNPEVLFQNFANERANIAALRSIGLDQSTARILDVGCGSGAGLLQFVRPGFTPANLVGIDSSAARIEEGKTRLPGLDFRAADATQIPFADGSFDLALESTMLGTLESQSLLASIAREMIRVTRKGGHIMLADWRYSREGSGVKTAITREKISELFGVGTITQVVARKRGALVPPLGQVTTVLRKND